MSDTRDFTTSVKPLAILELCEMNILETLKGGRYMRPRATSRTLSRAIKPALVLSYKRALEIGSGHTPEVTPDTFDSTCGRMVTSEELI